MVFRETTHRVAPFSIDRAMLGRRLPMLENSMGLAWLAAAAPAERQALPRMLGRGARLVGEVRRRGYALRNGGMRPHTATAVPIRAGGRVLGCIAAIWRARAVSVEKGLRQCLEPLRETAAEIEAGIAQAQGFSA